MTDQHDAAAREIAEMIPWALIDIGGDLRRRFIEEAAYCIDKTRRAAYEAGQRDMREAVATKVRLVCRACGGSGTHGPRVDPSGCEFCETPIKAIRALPIKGGNRG